MKYDDIRPSLQTFDILNCVPNNWFWGAIGHTAEVFRCKETDQVMVYESTQSERDDGKQGVQLRPMRKWLEDYPGRVNIRQVEFDVLQRRLAAERSCAAHIRQYRGTSYPNIKKWRGLWFVVNAAVDLPWKSRLRNPDIDDVMFCTHLFAHNWRFCGMMHGANPAEFEPDDTRYRGMFEDYIAPGITIDDEIELEI